jgi:two-component system phosphate regulon response regulator OmpR
MGRLVRFGRCVLDLDARKLFDADNQEVPLTAMEFDLLRTFAEHPNKALSRDRILDLAHNSDMEPFDRSVDSRIVRLRRKIEEDPTKPQVLKTLRGLGYMFVPSGNRT